MLRFSAFQLDGIGRISVDPAFADEGGLEKERRIIQFVYFRRTFFVLCDCGGSVPDRELPLNLQCDVFGVDAALAKAAAGEPHARLCGWTPHIAELMRFIEIPYGTNLIRNLVTEYCADRILLAAIPGGHHNQICILSCAVLQCQAELARDGRATQAPPAKSLDGLDRRDRCRMRHPAGRRAPVVKHPFAARPEPGQPLVGRALGNPGRSRSIRDAPAPCHDPIHQKDSTVNGHPRILMHVHPGAPVRVGWLRNPNLTSRPRMNNLHSFDS
ncbi:hypothetical protein CHELA40_10752 [Chelatococcus asaccharovorans]|nr:hypothetical protein CHELA40_10752 [Chelatococcus asaccharovorans]CAH1686129.1 hypothetical protein CHELA17_64852 [Chelatococcus asaccharovorans]